MSSRQRLNYMPLVVAALCAGLLVAASGGAFPSAITDVIPPTVDLAAGPHLDGDSYAALRGSGGVETIVFDLVVAKEGKNSRRSVVLGPDFVIERMGMDAILYDFRFRRLLMIDAKSVTFTNRSLYGMFQVRWAFLKDNMWAASVAASLRQGKIPALMRFWTEHANGLAAPATKALGNLPVPTVEARQEGAQLVVTAEGVTTMIVDLGDVAFPSAAHVASFGAWLAWSHYIHPRAAKIIANASFLPILIEMDRPVRFPAATDNDSLLRSSLEFSGMVRKSCRLDVTAGLRVAIPAWPPYLPEPLAALMLNAARGLAPGGPVGDATYARQIRALSDMDSHLDAALLAFHASHPYDGCADPQLSSDLCEAVINAIRTARRDQTGRKLIQALSVGDRGDHVASAEALIALRRVSLARPDILEVMIANELVEAKRASQLGEALATEYARLTDVFLSAFSVDPYDPARYRDFYNYLLVAGLTIEDGYSALLEGLVVMDIARVLPGRRIPSIVAQSTAVENQIAADFPLLFPDFGAMR